MGLVSIIICSHNGVDRLPMLIRSMQALQVGPRTDIEVIIVDSSSQDGTTELVRSTECPFPMRILRENRPGHSRALNRAIDASKGEILLFTDDDGRIEANWVHAYCDAAADVSNAGYFFGRILPILPDALPDWWKFAPRSMKGRDQGSELRIFDTFSRDSYPIGCNMAIRRSALGKEVRFEDALGPSPKSKVWLGADTRIGWDLQRRGLSGCYVPEAVVYHNIDTRRVSWKYLIRHAVASGRCSLYYKPEIRSQDRLVYATLSGLKCLGLAMPLVFAMMRRESDIAKRTQLSMMKSAGVLLEYASTLGGRIPK